MYVNLQKMHANYILDFVLFINNVSVCVPKSVDFILSMFFELISFEFNTLEIILKGKSKWDIWIVIVNTYC